MQQRTRNAFAQQQLPSKLNTKQNDTQRCKLYTTGIAIVSYALLACWRYSFRYEFI